MTFKWMIWVCIPLLLAGCATRSADKVFLEAAPLVPDQEGVVREKVLFPDYFLLDGYTLHDHGHIPRTRLIGAGMSAKLMLADVREQFNDVLHFQEWQTDRMEIGRQSFRIMASHAGETVEIRAVQGHDGPVEIFLLYTPKAR